MLHYKGWAGNVIAETPYHFVRRDFERRVMIARLQDARRLCDHLRIDIHPVYPRTLLSEIIEHRFFSTLMRGQIQGETK